MSQACLDEVALCEREIEREREEAIELENALRQVKVEMAQKDDRRRVSAARRAILEAEVINKLEFPAFPNPNPDWRQWRRERGTEVC